MSAVTEPNNNKIKASALLKKGPVTWGDEFRSAYSKAKRTLPRGVVTYQAIADRVSLLVPANQTTILRLGQRDTVPEDPSQRQMAYLALVAMGYDPREFELTHNDRRLRGMTEVGIRKVLLLAE